MNRKLASDMINLLTDYHLIKLSLIHIQLTDENIYNVSSDLLIEYLELEYWFCLMYSTINLFEKKVSDNNLLRQLQGTKQVYEFQYDLWMNGVNQQFRPDKVLEILDSNRATSQASLIGYSNPYSSAGFDWIQHVLKRKITDVVILQLDMLECILTGLYQKQDLGL